MADKKTSVTGAEKSPAKKSLKGLSFKQALKEVSKDKAVEVGAFELVWSVLQKIL